VRGRGDNIDVFLSLNVETMVSQYLTIES